MLASQIDADIATVHAEILAFLRRRAPQQAEELAQDVMERLIRNRHKLNDTHDLRAYGFVVARRILIDHYRKASVRQVLSFDPELDKHGSTDGDDPEASLHAAQIAEVVNRELQAMSAPMAEVFRLRTANDVPFQKIAEQQGVSINTALGRMHQATQRLANALRKHGLLPRKEGEAP